MTKQNRLGAPSRSTQADDSEIPRLALPTGLAVKSRGLTYDPENPLFQHAGLNYLKGRLRSHPDVAARHYAGL